MNINTITEIFLLGPGRVSRNEYTLRDKPHTDSFEQTCEKVRELVTGSIQRNCKQNVAAMLSGGLDSSIICAVAAGVSCAGGKTPPLQCTFSLDYEGNDEHFKSNDFQPDSDNAYIEKMSDFLGVEHHRIVLNSAELEQALYDAVDARGYPGMADVDSSLLLFCKKIKEFGFDCVLSGEGADEIFGGYPWYSNSNACEYPVLPWADNIDYRKSFIKEDVLREINEKQMFRLNLNWFGQTLIDRSRCMGKMAGVQILMPFTDSTLIEYMYNVPWEFKNYENREKGLLRHAFEGVLPDEVLWRKKSPYPKTHNPVYLKIVSDKLRQVIDNPDSPLLQYARKDSLERLLTGNISTRFYGQLMTVPQTIAYFLQVNYWLSR